VFGGGVGIPSSSSSSMKAVGIGVISVGEFVVASSSMVGIGCVGGGVGGLGSSSGQVVVSLVGRWMQHAGGLLHEEMTVGQRSAVAVVVVIVGVVAVLS